MLAEGRPGRVGQARQSRQAGNVLVCVNVKRWQEAMFGKGNREWVGRVPGLQAKSNHGAPSQSSRDGGCHPCTQIIGGRLNKAREIPISNPR